MLTVSRLVHATERARGLTPSALMTADMYVKMLVSISVNLTPVRPSQSTKWGFWKGAKLTAA